MPARRLPRSGPLWGTGDTPHYPPPGTDWSHQGRRAAHARGDAVGLARGRS